MVTHEKPDGDGLSSICAISDWLAELGKAQVLFCADPAPAQFSYLCCIENLVTDKSRLDFSEVDLVLIFDCGDLGRTKLSQEILSRKPEQKIVNIDHHPKVDDFADLEIKDPELSSTSELVYDFFKANRIFINKNRANCLLTGISSDTGNFLYPSTSDKTVQISSEMLMRGANLPHIIENTWRNKSLPAMKIWGVAMANLQVNKKYGIAYTVLTQADILSSGVHEEELEGIANFLGNLKDIKAIMFLREQADGQIKGSLRSSDPEARLDVLARALGGGGHAKASGFTVEGKLKKTDKGWEII